MALSFHAVFEGLAVGLEEDIADVWTLFGGNYLKENISIFSEALLKIDRYLSSFQDYFSEVNI